MGEVAKDTELKNTAQKAFKSYVRSVHLQPDKSTFNARKPPRCVCSITWLERHTARKARRRKRGEP